MTKRTHRRSVGVLLAVPTLALVAVGCGDDEPIGPGAGPTDAPATTEPSAEADDPSGSWRLVEAPVALVDGWDVTVTIDGDRIGGTAACNSYGGSLTYAAGAISVGELSSTEMGCEPAVMELEQSFLQFLGVVTSYAVDRTGDTAHLVLSGGGEAWTFERLPPVPTADLVGTDWVLDGYVSVDAVSNEPGMDAATLVLRPDGTVTGSTNCRTLTGTWVEAGAEIVFPTLTADGECPDAAAADLDGRILAVLGDGFTVAIDGRRLTITSQGDVGLTYRAA